MKRFFGPAGPLEDLFDRPAKQQRGNSCPTGSTPEDELLENAGAYDDEFPVGTDNHDTGGLDNSLPFAHDIESAFEEELEKTGKYASSLYTDAFNFALDTVLERESHLFSEEESEAFHKYKSLPYESQYLFVRLFLRKTAAWFRINRLTYHSEIADIIKASEVLWDPTTAFAENESTIQDLDEAIGLLSLNELKILAKDEKLTGTKKAQLASDLKKVSKRQGKLRAGGQLTLSFDESGRYLNRNYYFLKKILKLTGPCIRLTTSIVTLFERVHLVFYRSIEWAEKSLKTLILARISKRNFPLYIVSRTSNIFCSRSSLIEYEEAIKLQATVDDILENNGVPTQEGLNQVLSIFETVYPRWKLLVEEEAKRNQVHLQEIDYLNERVYLRRFSGAWVLTRIIHKGAYVLSRFKKYIVEHEVLTSLLSQQLYHPARRGAWYQRKALIEENYLANPPSDQGEKRKWRLIALKTCEQGLQDPGTNLIYHYGLQKRLIKLEQKLRIPRKDQHDFNHSQLLKPTERTVFGTRISEAAATAAVTTIGRKTMWLDPSNPSSPGCSVEEMCLATYRLEFGYKGFHCEGSLLRTLFAYLFYDILFLYVPNVFETDYQTCPLDLFTDAFYPTRISEINCRLAEIANGSAWQILQDVYNREHLRQTCVIGLDWSYGIQDLLEIVDCIRGEALATICKVMAQEYRQRGGGLPDLFLWKYGKKDEERECMFVEVKSENDRLSDTQRLWIHVLSTAGVRVELCKAAHVPNDEKTEEVSSRKDEEQ